MPSMLIVDDEPKIVNCLQRFFDGKGFTIRCAQTGQDAMKAMRADQPDIMLLDIRMPGMSGWDILKQTKELYPKTRVVMVSAFAKPESQVEASAYGADGYVTKPFNFSEATWAPVFSPPVA